MIKYLVISFATISLLFTNAACTSKQVDSEPDATAEMAEDGGMDPVEGSDGGEVAEGSSDFSEDDFGADDEGGSVAESEAPAASDGFDEATGDEVAAAETTPSDSTDDFGSSAALDESTTSDSTSDLGTEVPSDNTYADSGSSLGSDEMGGLSDEPPAPKPVVPLKKIQTTPWVQSGVLLNAVYIARPGDDFKTVSQKIYGTDERAAELRKVNPVIAARKMKVGDKIYYNSPRRPDDNMQLLTFHEDLGLSPEIYIAQPGDNIRDVAQRLLGDANSWKELWATNLDVESKGELPEGTRLRYWAGDLVAQAPTPTPPPMMPEPSMPEMAQQPEMAPPMPEEAPMPPMMADTEPPPPPPSEPPPPPMVAEAPPAPAEVQPPMDADSDPLAALLGEGGDQTTALMIGAILLIAAVALFIIIRKRKARRNIDFQTATHTQLD